MALPVLEVFAEHGYQLFHSPEAVYADFRSSGILRRSGIDVSSTSSSRLHQREALFDIALAHGLSSVIAVYVLAPQDDNKPTFLLQEPVAVQTWVQSHVDRARASAVANKSPEDLHATLRQLRGLRHVTKALVERLQRGQQAALPTTALHVLNDATSWNPPDDGSLAYLSSLQDDLTSLERLVEFTLWLVSRFHTSTLAIPSTSKMLHTILASAGLVDLLPLPVDISALFSHFQSVDALTTSAILLFLTLHTHHVHAKSWDDAHDLAMDAAAALHVPRLHAAHVLALWSVDHAASSSSSQRPLLQQACSVLSQSPPEFMDAGVVVAVLDALLEANAPDLAHTVATTCAVSTGNENEAQDATLLLLRLDTCLRLDAWALAWLLARRVPHHIDATMPRLIQYHQARGTVRDVLLKLTWTRAEMAIWNAQPIAATDLALLHLARGEFQSAQDTNSTSTGNDHEWNRQHHALLLRTVAPHAPEVETSSCLEGDRRRRAPSSDKSDRHAKEGHRSLTTPSAAAPAWSKPTKRQYEQFYNPLHKTLLSNAGSAEATPFSLHLKKPVAPVGSTSPKKGGGAPSRGTSRGHPTSTTLHDASDVMPYQWLSTELTPGPHSASKALSKRTHDNGEPLELPRPSGPHVFGHAFETPPRKPHHAKDSLPARRNPIRDVRKKY